VKYAEFDDNRIKHLEMLQAVVARLGGNGFLVKGWAITIAAGFSGFSLSQDNGWLGAIGFASVLFFWSMDAYFLRSERLFRALFTQVRSMDEWVAPFYMDATSDQFIERVKTGQTECRTDAASWWSSVGRPTLSIFYCTLLISTALVIIVTWCSDLAT
jgi:hypothetical protein